MFKNHFKLSSSIVFDCASFNSYFQVQKKKKCLIKNNKLTVGGLISLLFFIPLFIYYNHL